MANNTRLNPGQGGDIIATDDVDGIKHQLVKLEFGLEDSATMVSSSNPLPVSIIEPAIPKDYIFEITKGNVSGSSTITKFGLNGSINISSAPEDIWGQDGLYVAPTAARIHNIASTSSNDTSAGTGARTIVIRGINSDYNAQSETITLNGTNNVATVNSYFHIHLMQVSTGGSSGANIGNITATAQTDGTVTCTIPIGLNQSVSSIYMVPIGYKAYLMKWRARASNGIANSGAVVRLLNKPFGGVFQLKTQIGLNNSGSSFVEIDYTHSTPFILQGRSITKINCSSVTNDSTSIEGEYDLILVQD